MSTNTHRIVEVRVMMALRFTDANTVTDLVKLLYGDCFSGNTHPQVYRYLKELKEAGYVDTREGVNWQNVTVTIWSVTEDQFADFMNTLLFPSGRF